MASIRPVLVTKESTADIPTLAHCDGGGHQQGGQQCCCVGRPLSRDNNVAHELDVLLQPGLGGQKWVICW